jgi:beta-lactamase class A
MLGPLGELQSQLALASYHAPGHVAIAIEDLATGATQGINESASMPAASTIKIPVMVEVFRQMEDGDIDLNTLLHVESQDRDWGWGDLADAAEGTPKTVKQLLWLMITQSDNTATNMLIRLVGRQNVNRTMSELGLHHTTLGDYIRSQTNAIRYALRSSPGDMVKLLDTIARDRCIDAWSSKEMLAILSGQTHNGLLPQPLPAHLTIAHKTGSLHDTLNDVGIVYLAQEPYVIAVMTTQLPDLDLGRSFIHKVSRMAYDTFGKFATWRVEEGLPGFSPSGLPADGGAAPTLPDVSMWGGSSEAAAPAATAAHAPPVYLSAAALAGQQLGTAPASTQPTTLVPGASSGLAP